MTTFPDMQQAELEYAQLAYGHIASAHEGYAILLEEVVELQAEVFKQPQIRSLDRMLKELIQIAAMAQRMAEDLKLC